jgi:FtsP/CotA-like multicopper oxidase with cupredoxin domain
MSSSNKWHYVLLLGLISTQGVAQAANENPCPRPPIGGTVSEPEDLRSKNGLLKVELDYHRVTGENGQTRFCFMNADGNQSPNLRLKPGDELIISLKNSLPPAAADGSSSMIGHAMSPTVCTSGPMTGSSANLHFHGLVIAPICHQDDTLNTAIQPSDPPFEYKFKIPNDQPPGIYWYHPHIHGFARAQILGGASGALIVEGIEAANRQVRGLGERIFVIRDQELLHPDAQEIWKGPGPAPPVIKDADGDVINTGTGYGKPAKDLSINYVPVPFPEYKPAVIKMRPSERQFWRVLNASAITYVDLRLIFDDVPQVVGLISIDGVPLNHEHPEKQVEQKRDHILLPPAGRAEFIVTGPAAGVRASLITRSIDTGRVGDNDPLRPLADIVVSADAPKPRSSVSTASARLAPRRFPPLSMIKPVRQRVLYFSERQQDPKNPSSPTMFFVTVDGQTPKQFDPSSPLPDITVRSGDVEDWIIENRSKELHAFHIHQIHFQLLEFNGVKVNEPFLRDTVNVDYWREKVTEWPSVKLRMDFRDPKIVGTFAYHCHLLEHQDNGMMGIIRVEPRAAKSASKKVAGAKLKSAGQ